MQVQPDLNLLDEEKEILKSILSITDSEKGINSEIARKEFASLVNFKIKPYLKNSDDFKTWISGYMSLKQALLMIFLPIMLLICIAAGGILIGVGIINMILILAVIVYKFYVLTYFSKQETEISVFYKCKISTGDKSINVKMKILSYFSIFLDNDWKPNLFTNEEKEKVLISVLRAIDSEIGSKRKVQKIYAQVLWRFYVDEGFAKEKVEKTEDVLVNKALTTEDIASAKVSSLDFKKEIFFSK